MLNNDQKIMLIGRHSTDNKEFENILKEVFPTDVPVKFIDHITVDFINGEQVTLDHSEIKHPLPIDHDKTWRDLISAFDMVNLVTVVIDIDMIKDHVTNKVGDLLGAHF